MEKKINLHEFGQDKSYQNLSLNEIAVAFYFGVDRDLFSHCNIQLRSRVWKGSTIILCIEMSKS